MKNIFLMVAVFMLASCAGTPTTKSEEVVDEKYFSGTFVYYADAATFTDCATGLRYPVSVSGAYLDAERAYKALDPHFMEGLMIDFYGEINSEVDEEAGERLVAMIDKVIQVERRACDFENTLAGLYVANMSDNKHTLKLNTDYTYTEMVYNNAQNPYQVHGTWYRTSLLELVLVAQTPNEEYRRQVFEFVPSLSTLSRSSGGEPLVYEKDFI